MSAHPHTLSAPVSPRRPPARAPCRRYQYLVTSKKIGDELAVSLLRRESGGAAAAPFDINKLAATPGTPTPLELKVTLAPAHELVPRELGKDYHPQFAVVGGLVFVIAGLPLLNQALAEKRWGLFDRLCGLLSPPPRNAPKEELPERDTEAILCSDCLAHDVNEGFRSYVGLRLQKINGVQVRNMAHVVEILTPLLDPSTALTQQWTVLQFFSSEHSVVFETEALRTATPRIQEQHKLPSWTSLAVRDER